MLMDLKRKSKRMKMVVDWKVLLELWVMGLENVEMEEMFWKWN